jgi:hypothetical protein
MLSWSQVIRLLTDWWWPQPKPEPAPSIAPEPEPEPKRLRGKYDTETGRLREDIADHMDMVTERLSNVFAAASKGGLSHSDIELLEGMLGSDFLLYSGRDLYERLAPGDKFSDELGKELSEAVWPVNFGFVGFYNRDSEVPHISMQWVYSTTPKAARGKVRRIAPKMLHIIDVRLGDNGAWWIYEYYAGLIGNQWVPLDDGIAYERQTSLTVIDSYTRQPYGVWMRRVIRAAMNAQLTSRYHWHVAFGSEPGPRVLLPTNPNSCLKLFRNRETDNQKRRSALRHWVANHYAEHEEAGSVYVRDHLRGNTNFRWANFPCEIMVSAYDLEKNEFFREQAAEWRATRKHNRVKVRLKKKPS